MDESVPAHRDAPASSSRESASEPRGKVVSGKHSIFTHFPKEGTKLRHLQEDQDNKGWLFVENPLVQPYLEQKI